MTNEDSNKCKIKSGEFLSVRVTLKYCIGKLKIEHLFQNGKVLNRYVKDFGLFLSWYSSMFSVITCSIKGLIGPDYWSLKTQLTILKRTSVQLKCKMTPEKNKT